jgi:hypothetical protein
MIELSIRDSLGNIGSDTTVAFAFDQLSWTEHKGPKE